MFRRTGAIGAAGVLAFTLMAAVAPSPASAASCSVRSIIYDTEQGSGGGYSFCTRDAASNIRHRVGIYCNGRGPTYSRWQTRGIFATTWCAGGQRGTGAVLQVKYV